MRYKVCLERIWVVKPKRKQLLSRYLRNYLLSAHTIHCRLDKLDSS